MLTVKQVFELGLKMGVSADPRGAKGVTKYLEKINKEYENLGPNDKKYFDKEKLVNPYTDSIIHVNDEKTTVKRILTGIDIGGSEILLASQLGERGKKIDLVIAHHPMGKSLAQLADNMEMLTDIFEAQGVPAHLADKFMAERMQEVARGIAPINHYQPIDVARILGINLINTHTITDNLVLRFLENYLAKIKPNTVGDVVEALLDIPEYQEAKRRGYGPTISSGSARNRLGKYFVEMTGGTNPSKHLYSSLSQFGVSTVIGMHMKEDAHEKANEHKLNIVIAGHISSDSLGMNLYLDELEKKGIEIVPCGGLIRVSRVNKKKK